jgi:hypothetical protein
MTKKEILESIALEVSAKENISVQRARAAVRRVTKGMTIDQLMNWL